MQCWWDPNSCPEDTVLFSVPFFVYTIWFQPNYNHRSSTGATITISTATLATFWANAVVRMLPTLRETLDRMLRDLSHGAQTSGRRLGQKVPTRLWSSDMDSRL